MSRRRLCTTSCGAPIPTAANRVAGPWRTCYFIEACVGRTKLLSSMPAWSAGYVCRSKGSAPPLVVRRQRCGDLRKRRSTSDPPPIYGRGSVQGRARRYRAPSRQTVDRSRSWPGTGAEQTLAIFARPSSPTPRRPWPRCAGPSEWHRGFARKVCSRSARRLFRRRYGAVHPERGSSSRPSTS